MHTLVILLRAAEPASDDSSVIVIEMKSSEHTIRCRVRSCNTAIGSYHPPCLQSPWFARYYMCFFGLRMRACRRGHNARLGARPSLTNWPRFSPFLAGTTLASRWLLVPKQRKGWKTCESNGLPSIIADQLIHVLDTLDHNILVSSTDLGRAMSRN
jgi:hypothetical protein